MCNVQDELIIWSGQRVKLVNLELGMGTCLSIPGRSHCWLLTQWTSLCLLKGQFYETLFTEEYKAYQFMDQFSI